MTLREDDAHDTVSKDVLVRALAPLSTRFAELGETLRIERFSRSTLFDLTPFRASPLWIMPNGTALCVDVALLVERLGAHAFWSVINALDTPERRKQFTSTWGSAFEAYCLDQSGSPRDRFPRQEVVLHAQPARRILERVSG